MAFKNSFKSSWLFDVEIFIRIRNYYSVNNAQMHIKEVPLNSWVHQEGSKITLKDSMRIPLELNGINMSYNIAPRLNTAIYSGKTWPTP